ncbi:MAG: 2'-5' RNA ligase family protein [Anaerolineae bacterium]|nr:2'-5' RNA ligase family protein [Anaerolineae bacterium]
MSSDQEGHKHQADEVARAEAPVPLTAQVHTLEAVVAVLDEEHRQQVAAVWDELREKFGVADVFETPIPHFSYHVAEKYDGEALDAVLRQVARETPPFTITTAGLGVFTGPQPVLYVPVARDATLCALQAGLVERLQPIAVHPVCHYLPENWFPHITLALGTLEADKLAAIMAHLAPRSFHWHVRINNLAVICDNCGVYGVSSQYALKG